MASYDVIVVGAGVVGSATAYQLVKRGYKVLLLEQFSLGHSRGSSHGHSRITRKAYPQDYYSRMMIEAYDQWAVLEKECGQQLFVKCGLLNLGKPTEGHIPMNKKSLDAISSPYDLLTPAQIRQRFPTIHVGPEFVGLYDPEAGVLKADRCLQALQAGFRARGGELHDEERVMSVRPGSVVTVTTSRGSTYCATSLVLTAGPWAAKLLQPLGLTLPLQPQRIKVFYWKTKQGGHDASCFPTLIQEGMTTQAFRHAYGLPCLEYPDHVKMCVHNGAAIDPDLRDADSADSADSADGSAEKAIAGMIRNYFPGIEDKPSITETCIYTVTPDEDYVIDTHPAWKNIVIGAGFSGHGFKLAPISGKLLAELATGRPLSYDVKPFAIDRFRSSTPAAKL